MSGLVVGLEWAQKDQSVLMRNTVSDPLASALRCQSSIEAILYPCLPNADLFGCNRLPVGKALISASTR